MTIEQTAKLQLPGLELQQLIGSGGMASVWKAYDTVRQRMVAVKILTDSTMATRDGIQQFKSEEGILEEIHHPNIVEAYAFNCHRGVWYYVMEYVNGYTFADLLKRKQHVREPDCLLICESVASALSFAWNDHGVVHCDIKPENLMVNTDGVIKVLDLGISHRYEFRDGPMMVADHVLGTPAYISPEQVYGDVELDCRSDIYSLAATLYHLATGRMLFPGLDNDDTMRAHCDDARQARDPRSYRPELSEGFCQLLELMLIKNRNYRPADWGEIYEICADVESGAKFKRRDPGEAASSLRLMR